MLYVHLSSTALFFAPLVGVLAFAVSAARMRRQGAANSKASVVRAFAAGLVTTIAVALVTFSLLWHHATGFVGLSLAILVFHT